MPVRGLLLAGGVALDVQREGVGQDRSRLPQGQSGKDRAEEVGRHQGGA